MNKVTFRFFDPIIYAINALKTHWKKLLLIELFFFILGRSIDWVMANTKPLFQFKELPDRITVGESIVFVSILLIGLVLARTLLSLWATSAIARISLHIYEGKPIGFNEIVSSLHNIFSVLGLWALWLLFCVMVGFSGFIAVILARPFLVTSLGNNGFTIMIGALGGLAFLLFWWLFYRTLLSTFFIVDNDWGAYRSLVASYHLTKNKFWLLMGVDFVILAFAALLWALLLACAFALLTLFNMNEYSFQLNVQTTALFCLSSFIIIGLWMSMLANGYIYRKLLESSESTDTQLHVQDGV